MPTVNMLYGKESHGSLIVEAINPLKEFIARELSCSDMTLGPDEVSIRVLRSLGHGMLGDVEMDMTAAPFQERIDRQDEICLNVRSFALEQLPDISEVKVWLNLHELGHSWEG